MGIREDAFHKQYGVNKNDLVFSKKNGGIL